ncbi:hypothetical protein DDZ13_11120 [Coraliomargarita sinensis]|uniref:Uncharacterized protein n=1 Tax=Coraliomargarita sinensis TaxID=2174842 RepID=A0A317ZGN9_9BACT|nr:hypothetical protein DDZ13_11120 [Coraliomargarita sinensis]
MSQKHAFNPLLITLRRGSACGCHGFVQKPQLEDKAKHRLYGAADIRKRSPYGPTATTAAKIFLRLLTT